MSDFICQSCGYVIRADCPARINAEYSREPNPCVPVDANEIERLRARVAELEAAHEWRPIEREAAMKLVNALWGAGFKEGMLEHHPSPSNATLKKAGDASQVAKDALIAVLTAPPKVAT